MAITDVNTMDFGLFQNILGGFDFGTDLLTIVLISISAIIITRDTRNLRLLLLPLAVAWGRAGLDVPVWLISVTAVITIVTLVGAHNIGATLNSIQETITGTLRQGKMGKKWAANKAIAGAQADAAAWQGTQSIRTQQLLKEAEESNWMDNATQDIQMEKALRKDRFSNKLWANTQAGRTAKAIKAAEEADWLDKATQDLQFKKALRKDRFGNKLWTQTQATRTQRAMQKAEEELWLQRANYNTNMKKELNRARFRDKLDVLTTPTQIRKGVRSKWTGRAINTYKDERDYEKWLEKQAKRLKWN